MSATRLFAISRQPRSPPWARDSAQIMSASGYPSFSTRRDRRNRSGTHRSSAAVWSGRARGESKRRVEFQSPGITRHADKRLFDGCRGKSRTLRTADRPAAHPKGRAAPGRSCGRQSLARPTARIAGVAVGPRSRRNSLSGGLRKFQPRESLKHAVQPLRIISGRRERRAQIFIVEGPRDRVLAPAPVRNIPARPCRSTAPRLSAPCEGCAAR